MMTLKKILAALMVLCMLLSAVGCQEQEKSETQETAETLELTPTQQAAEDEKFLAQFIKDYRGGKYKEQQLFDYEDFTVFYQLGEYKGLEYVDDEMLNETVTDAEVDDYLTGIQVAGILQEEDFEELTEGTVAKFDTVIIDFRGLVDGKEMEQTSGKDQELLIGSNQFIDGFESGLIGAEIGKEVLLEIQFSPYYSDAAVAGKPVQFYVTVKSLTRPKAIPELTVEAINTLYGSDFADMTEVRKDIGDYLKSEKESAAYSALANYLQMAVQKNSEVIEYPREEVEFYRNHFTEYYTQGIEEGQTLDEFCEENLGVTFEEFDADALTYAEETVAGTLMLRVLAQKENLTCSDEQLEAVILGLYETYGSYYGSLESFVADYVDLYGADYFESRVITAAAIELIVENAVKVG